MSITGGFRLKSNHDGMYEEAVVCGGNLWLKIMANMARKP